MDRDRIKLGGIVIGTKDRILKGASNYGDISVRQTHSISGRNIFISQMELRS